MFALRGTVLLEAAVFVIVSAVIVLVSWRSLRDWRGHGFWRFFAFEAIASLILVNVERWFEAAFAPHQLVSWFLLTVSVVPVVLGVRELRGAGRPDASRADSSLLGFERTTRLVTTGIFRYVRHPMYCSLLLLAWGTYFKSCSWVGLALVLVATAALVATALADERECLAYFGPAYRDYATRTRRFIPFVV